MFGVDSTELIIVAVAALIFIGPKELPATMRTVGRWIGKARGMARHFTAGVENMIREAELEEMENKWREENARIIAQFPTDAVYPDPAANVLPADHANPPVLMTEQEQPTLPLAAPPAPDDDPRPPRERDLP